MLLYQEANNQERNHQTSGIIDHDLQEEIWLLFHNEGKKEKKKKKFDETSFGTLHPTFDKKLTSVVDMA